MKKAYISTWHPVSRLFAFLLALVVLISPLFSITSQVTQLLLGTLVMLGLMLAWARKVELLDGGVFGLQFDRIAVCDFAIGLILGGLAVAAMLGFSIAFGLVQALEINRVAIDSAFLSLATKALLVSTWEEALFRGLLPFYVALAVGRHLETRLALVVAVLVPSVLFAAAHAWTDHFNAFAFGVLLLTGASWYILVLFTERLALSIGLHAAWNFAQIKIFGFAMSGNAPDRPWIKTELTDEVLFSGGNYGPEAGILGLLGVVVMLLSSLVYCRLTGRKGIRTILANEAMRET